MKKGGYILRFLILAGLVLGALYYFLIPWRYLVFVSKNPTITLTSKGYVPNKLVVREGALVKFKNSSETQFWPASNSHPLHDMLKQFDPKRALERGEEWTVKFYETGEWGYHDHLKPSLKGTVIVLDASGRLPTLDECGKLRGDAQKNCLYNGITKVITKKGLKAGFDKFVEIYSEYGKSYETDCHQITHLLGEISYKEFKKNTGMSLPIEVTSMCGYGFFHGYTEALIADGREITLAKDYCTDYASKYKDIDKSLEYTCFHGIGHSIFDTSDFSLWGDDDKMVENAISICRQLGSSDKDVSVFQCADGVYSALGVAYFNNFYKLSFRKDDPFWICDKQPDLFRDVCYASPGTLWIKSRLGEDFDLAEAVKLSKKINHKKGYDYFLVSLVQEYYKANMGNLEPIAIVQKCNTLVPGSLASCISGVHNGMLATDPSRIKENAKIMCEKMDMYGTTAKEMCQALTM